MKILIIEDDELVRMTYRNVLKRAGYTVFEAENGDEGIACFKKHKPDLVITDLLMPDKEGLETICEIRALNPTVKIVAISTGGSTRNVSFLKIAKDLGANCALRKPISPSDLLAATKDMLKS